MISGCPDSISNPTSSEKPQDLELPVLRSPPFKSKTAKAAVVPGSTTIVYVLFGATKLPPFSLVVEIASDLQRAQK
jgi:hypothetical protein